MRNQLLDKLQSYISLCKVFVTLVLKKQNHTQHTTEGYLIQKLEAVTLSSYQNHILVANHMGDERKELQ